jgi:hypothetical protein
MDGRSARNLEKSVCRCGVEEMGLWFMLMNAFVKHINPILQSSAIRSVHAIILHFSLHGQLQTRETLYCRKSLLMDLM